MNHYSYRAARATDLALVTDYPLEILAVGDEQRIGDAQREGIVAVHRGATVTVNQTATAGGLPTAAVVVVVGRFADDLAGRASLYAGVAPLARDLIADARATLYGRDWAPATLALEQRARARLTLPGRDWETLRVLARGCAALQSARTILPEHYAEALSYRRPTTPKEG